MLLLWDQSIFMVEGPKVPPTHTP